ncbi:MAG: DHH family phosphoesterase [bacterium]
MTEIIVTHVNADFDALASMAAAQLLYPEAKLVIPGSCEKNVREYLENIDHELSLYSIRQIDPKKIKRLIIVDTHSSGRVEEFETLIESQPVIHIYDHHPGQDMEITPEVSVIKEQGATITILLDLIREKRLTITPVLATLFLLGIYEETGAFTFPTTTEFDLSTAAYLFSQQADLKTVNRFSAQTLNNDQLDLLADLIKSRRIHFLPNGREIMLLKSSLDKYISDLAVVIHKIMDLARPQAMLAMVWMKDRVYVIGRSRIPEINVSRILLPLGGGGHSSAASATIKEIDLKEVENKIIDCLDNRTSQSYLNIKDLMEERLPYAIQELIKKIAEAADQASYPCFIVGGLVRDILLGKISFDLDVVVEGDGIDFSRLLVKKSGGEVKRFAKFKTAVVSFPNGFKLDVATARTEHYAYPGALPKVKPSSIREDLFRRDFTINALAIQINAAHYGDLIDFFGGRNDLAARLIRVLHPDSFRDDPTRIFRAVRFENRLGFITEAGTEGLMKEAVADGMLEQITNQRIREELIQILSEDQPYSALKKLQDRGILARLHPALSLPDNLVSLFKQIHDILFHFRLIIGEKEIETWLIYFLAMTEDLDYPHIERLVSDLKFTRRQKNKILTARKRSQRIIDLLTVSPQSLTPAFIYRELQLVSTETLILVMARISLLPDKNLSEEAKRRVATYLVHLNRMKVMITGEDLKGMGIPPGPEYTRIKEAVFSARLDGHVLTKADELDYVQTHFGQLRSQKSEARCQKPKDRS